MIDVTIEFDALHIYDVLLNMHVRLSFVWFLWYIFLERGIVMALLKDFESCVDFMRDTKNWCFVHATKYLPHVRPDGKMYIQTTGAATNFEFPRTTIHATLNHVVTSHGYGSWDDSPIIILAPYNDIISDNGKPVEIAGTDTYWSVNPDKGLVLPESAYVVKPDNNGSLFQVGERGATYKRGDYTDQEIKEIEAMIDDPYDWAEYTRYKNGDLEPWEIKRELDADERVRKMYNSAGDKKAFLCGLFEQSRFSILAKHLRNAVVKKAMEKKGMNWVNGISDCSKISMAIANTAEADGIAGNVSNKGHANSFYGEMDSYADEINQVFQSGTHVIGIPAIFKTDIKSLYDIIVARGWKDNPLVFAVLTDLIGDKPINFLELYQDCYTKRRDEKMSVQEFSLERMQEELKLYTVGDFSKLDETSRNKEIQRCEARITKLKKYISEMSAKTTIADYDKNLWLSIQRHCARLASEYNAWRSELIKSPEYANLVQRLRMLIATPSNRILRQDRQM